MRILYIAPYAAYSGYSQAALSNIAALDSAGIKVACRHLDTIPKVRKLSERMKELENNDFKEYDAVIQHVPPYMFSYDSRAGLNIGIFYTETEPFPTVWAHYANLMDLILVPSSYEKDLVSKAIDKPVELVHIPSDLSVFEKNYVDKVSNKIVDGNFLFYTIGELVARKNLAGLLRAFYAEFDLSEPVKLVIKTNLVGAPEPHVKSRVGSIINETKQNLRIYQPDTEYMREKVVLGNFSDEDLICLHKCCDCFVQPSRGESWSIPAFTAMALGKTPIVSDCGGFKEYMDNDCGWITPVRKEPISGDWSVHPELYNSRQYWHNPCLKTLRMQLREAYENEELRKNKAKAGVLKSYQFSTERVGIQLKEIIEKHVNKKRKA